MYIHPPTFHIHLHIFNISYNTYITYVTVHLHHRRHPQIYHHQIWQGYHFLSIQEYRVLTLLMKHLNKKLMWTHLTIKNMYMHTYIFLNMTSYQPNWEAYSSPQFPLMMFLNNKLKTFAIVKHMYLLPSLEFDSIGCKVLFLRSGLRWWSWSNDGGPE
jgi:hypothetical protein